MKVDQNLLFIALELGDMDEEEFLMFYDINRTHNLDLPYWKHEKFDLDHLEHVYMGPEVNSNRFEISLRGKISLRCKVTSLSAFT